MNMLKLFERLPTLIYQNIGISVLTLPLYFTIITIIINVPDTLRLLQELVAKIHKTLKKTCEFFLFRVQTCQLVTHPISHCRYGNTDRLTIMTKTTATYLDYKDGQINAVHYTAIKKKKFVNSCAPQPHNATACMGQYIARVNTLISGCCWI